MIDHGDVVSMRRERLLEAIRRLEEMNGSPDLLEACQRALQILKDFCEALYRHGRTWQTPYGVPFVRARWGIQPHMVSR